MKKTWNLMEAVEFCRNMENQLRPVGYHVALTGGCLYKEGERKDLDVFIYRTDNFTHSRTLREFELKSSFDLTVLKVTTESKKDYDGTGLNHFTMQRCVTSEGKVVELFYVSKEFIK